MKAGITSTPLRSSAITHRRHKKTPAIIRNRYVYTSIPTSLNLLRKAFSYAPSRTGWGSANRPSSSNANSSLFLTAASAFLPPITGEFHHQLVQLVETLVSYSLHHG